MVKQYKIDRVKELVTQLQEKGNFILTDYSGVQVTYLNSLRRSLREQNADYKVVKNNLFKRALKDAGYEGLDSYIKGPIGVAFTDDEIGDVAKVLKNFKKEQENFSFTAGMIDNVVFDAAQVAKIADLPSRDVLLSQIMSLVNGPTTGIATGMNQVMASLARGIKAVAEGNNQ